MSGFGLNMNDQKKIAVGIMGADVLYLLGMLQQWLPYQWLQWALAIGTAWTAYFLWNRR